MEENGIKDTENKLENKTRVLGVQGEFLDVSFADNINEFISPNPSDEDIKGFLVAVGIIEKSPEIKR